MHVEISKELLGKVVPGVAIYTEDQIGVTHEYDATVADIAEMLKPLGLEITTIDAVDWSSDYPGSAAAATRICLLQQEIADLQHELGINPKSAVHEKLAE